MQQDTNDLSRNKLCDIVVFSDASEAALGVCEHICKRCMECKRVLATSHLLDLHIREAHDAMFALLAEKQPMVRSNS